MALHQLGRAQQVLQGVGEALDLEELGALDPPAGADDGVAGADDNCGIRIDGRAPSLSSRVKQSCMLLNLRLLGLAEVEVREQPPQPDRRVADQRLLDLAEPAHELRQQAPRDAVGQQEVDVLLLKDLGDRGAELS